MSMTPPRRPSPEASRRPRSPLAAEPSPPPPRISCSSEPRPKSPTSGNSPRPESPIPQHSPPSITVPRSPIKSPKLVLPDGQVANGRDVPDEVRAGDVDLVQVEEELMEMMLIPEDFLTQEEEEVLEEFCGDIARIRRLNDRDATREYAVKFLMARKFNPSRGFSLYQRYKMIRQKYEMDKLNPTEDPLYSELATGKFTFLHSVDQDEAIGVFTGALHKPDVDVDLLIKGLLFNIDEALRSFSTVACGITLLINMRGVKPSKSDRMLAETILDLLQDQYPARIRRVYVVDAPWYMRHLFRFLSPFMKPKMRERVSLVRTPQLLNYFRADQLPVSLGGSRLLNHSEWLSKALMHYQYIKGSRPYADKSSCFKRRLLPEQGRANTSPLTRRSLAVQTDQQEKKMRSPSLPGDAAEQINACLLQQNVDHVAYLRALHTMNGLTLDSMAALLAPQNLKDLFEEFSEIQAAPLKGSFETTRLPHNISKNRSADIFCTEDTRVKLSPIYQPNGVKADGSDYIHANFVAGLHQPKTYILTQGPMESTLGDFWRMVWEQEVHVIVMAANLVENGVSKCYQYWPESDGVVRIADFTLRVTDVMETEDWTRRVISVRRARAATGRRITHYHFTTWGEGQVKSPVPMIQVMLDMHRRNDVQEHAISAAPGRNNQAHSAPNRKTVRSLGDAEGLDAIDPTATENRPTCHPPILVHCSTGVGRSAALVTADLCCMALMQGTVDIAGTVCHLRTQRAQSIKTFAQYKLIYDVTVEFGRLLQQAESQANKADAVLRDMPASHSLTQV